MKKYVVRVVERGSDLDDTGPETWLGMEVARFDDKETAETFARNCYAECEVEEVNCVL